MKWRDHYHDGFSQDKHLWCQLGQKRWRQQHKFGYCPSELCPSNWPQYTNQNLTCSLHFERELWCDTCGPRHLWVSGNSNSFFPQGKFSWFSIVFQSMPLSIPCHHLCMSSYSYQLIWTLHLHGMKFWCCSQNNLLQLHYQCLYILHMYIHVSARQTKSMISKTVCKWNYFLIYINIKKIQMTSFNFEVIIFNTHKLFNFSNQCLSTLNKW